jgi:hypothetical protein
MTGGRVASLPASDVARLIASLRSGAMNLPDVAEEFRRRTWPRARRPEPQSDLERAAQLDRGLPVAGSIDEVTAAYDRGEITAHEYDVLCEAVADSVRRERADGTPAE